MNQDNYELMLMIDDNHKYVVFDGFGDSLRSFADLNQVQMFIKTRPECTYKEILPLSYHDLLKLYGESPY